MYNIYNICTELLKLIIDYFFYAVKYVLEMMIKNKTHIVY